MKRPLGVSTALFIREENLHAEHTIHVFYDMPSVWDALDRVFPLGGNGGQAGEILERGADETEEAFKQRVEAYAETLRP